MGDWGVGWLRDWGTGRLEDWRIFGMGELLQGGSVASGATLSS